MKKISLIVLLISNVLCAQQNWLYKINDSVFNVRDFESFYKTNLEVNHTFQDINNLIDASVLRTLKIKDAYNKNMDKLSEVNEPIKKSLKKIAFPYLYDTVYLNKIVESKYEQKKYDLNVQHILFSVQDVEQNPDLIKDVVQKIKNKKLTFEQAVLRYSKDPTVKVNKGDLGYIKPFSLVVDAEDFINELEEGEISKPLKTSYGWHVFKVYKKEKAFGTYNVRYLLLNKNHKEDSIKIYKLYQEMIAHPDKIKAIVQKNSQHPSAVSRGLLTKVGAELPISIKEKVKETKLKVASTPFHNDFGWQIVVPLKKYKTKSFKEVKLEMVQDVLRSDYRRKLEDMKLEKLKERFDFKALVDFKHLSKYVKYNTSKSIYYTSFKKNLFKYRNTDVKLSDFIKYLNSKKESISTVSTDLFLKEKVNRYLRAYLKLDYSKNIFEYEPEIKNKIRELTHSLMLYEYDKKYIDTKIGKDSVALSQIYEQEKVKHYFPDRAHMLVVELRKKELRKKVLEDLRQGLSKKELIKKYNSNGKPNIFISGYKVAKKGKEIPFKFKFKKGVRKYKHKGKEFLICISKIEKSRLKYQSEIVDELNEIHKTRLENEIKTSLYRNSKIEKNEVLIRQLTKKYNN